MKKKCTILLSIIWIFGQSGFGQALGIGAPGLINFPDTGYGGYSVNISLYVKNTGSVAYSGSFSIDYSVNSVTQPGSLYSGFLSNLMAGDSSLISINNFYFYSTVYSLNAINVVVVWPRAPSPVPTSDSSTISVYVADSSYYNNGFSTQTHAINSGDAEPMLFPNPASETLSILNTAPEHIQIIEMIEFATGKVVRRFNTTSISLHDIRSGYYFLTISLKNGQRKYLKFVKT